MSLSSLYLDAFKEVAKTESFSEAAKNLFVTQSALSQRVKNLERDLSLTLFIRTPGGAVLTEQGLRLLRYCETKDSLEGELLTDLKFQNSKDLSGVIRLGVYSSVYRSVVLPALNDLLKKNPLISVEFTCSKIHSLPQMLTRGEVDIVILDYELSKFNVERMKLGYETLIAIQNKKGKVQSVFLDNDVHDLATENFFKHQSGKTPKYSRSYFDDCYGIIDGVAGGLGQAVMPQHLVHKNNKIKKNDSYKPVKTDVWLHYFKQPFYSRLQSEVINELKKNSAQLLL